VLLLSSERAVLWAAFLVLVKDPRYPRHRDDWPSDGEQAPWQHNKHSTSITSTTEVQGPRIDMRPIIALFWVLAPSQLPASLGPTYLSH